MKTKQEIVANWLPRYTGGSVPAGIYAAACRIIGYP